MKSINDRKFKLAVVLIGLLIIVILCWLVPAPIFN